MYPAGVPGVAARFVTTRAGLRVRVTETGCPAGRPVVCIHGWGGSAYLFRKNLPALADAGFHAIAPDLPGHGSSDKPLDPAAYTLPALGAYVVEILDALGLPRVALMGQSMGGAVAAEVALRWPERVEKLVLLAPVGYGRIGAVAAVRALAPAVIAPLLPRFTMPWMFSLVLRGVYGTLGAPTSRDVAEYFAPTADPRYIRALHSLIRNLDWSPDDGGRMRGLRMPCLVVFGSADPIIPQGALERYRRDAPSVRTVEIPGGGHLINEEAPDAVNAAILEFLKAS